jgi:hypothetical protein
VYINSKVITIFYGVQKLPQMYTCNTWYWIKFAFITFYSVIISELHRSLGHDRMVVGFTSTLQSVPITTIVVSLNPVHGEPYLIQQYVETEILLKVALNTISLYLNCIGVIVISAFTSSVVAIDRGLDTQTHQVKGYKIDICYGRVSSSCYNSGNRHATLVIKSGDKSNLKKGQRCYFTWNGTTNSWWRP